MKEPTREALRMAGIYALASAAWILFSDLIVDLLASDHEAMTRLAIYKGWGFVLLTSLLLFSSLRHRLAQLNDAKDRTLEDSRRIKEQMRSLSSLFGASQALAESGDVKAKADSVTKACVEQLGAKLAWIGRLGKTGRIEVLSVGPEGAGHLWLADADLACGEDASEGPAGKAIRGGLPIVVDDLDKSAVPDPWLGRAKGLGVRSAAAFPLITRGRTFGVLALCSDLAAFFAEDRISVFQALANQAAAGLETAALLEQTQRRLEHIEALHDIDLAIGGSVKDKAALDVALEGIMRQLKVDAASILSYDPQSRSLGYEAGRGFSSVAAGKLIGEDVGILTKVAVVEGRPLEVLSVSEICGEETRGGLAREGFVCYTAVPLSAKGKLLGALELFGRRPFDEDEEWYEFLKTLAGQTAVAFDNLDLLRTLERSNEELVRSYDATIEALAFALELKDSDTTWHSKRVTELTLRLARHMGLDEEALVQVRRGAFLHDIGKMGIPDSVLLKPGALDAEEMEVMRKHPVYAQQMLSRIAYLRPALDIPYAHHERWDGTGYPRGLKAEEIPLAARIFAVVDVFDALTSDRPYRKAWPRADALAEIRAKSGRQFDPRVVDAFFALPVTDPLSFDYGEEAGRPKA